MVVQDNLLLVVLRVGQVEMQYHILLVKESHLNYVPVMAVVVVNLVK